MSEDSKPERSANPGCLARAFVFGAAASAVGAYLMGGGPVRPGPSRAGGAGGAVPFYCDVETECSDGTFLSTSNSEGSALTAPPSAIHKLRRPIDTPLGEMLKDHEGEKQKLLAAKGGESCVESLTLADAI